MTKKYSRMATVRLRNKTEIVPCKARRRTGPLAAYWRAGTLPASLTQLNPNARPPLGVHGNGAPLRQPLNGPHLKMACIGGGGYVTGNRAFEGGGLVRFSGSAWGPS